MSQWMFLEWTRWPTALGTGMGQWGPMGFGKGFGQMEEWGDWE